MSDNFSRKQSSMNFTGDKYHVLSNYYDVIADSKNDFDFLSPVNITTWLNQVSNWLVEAKSIIEIGCGYGQLCYECLNNASSLQEYCIVDISGKLLSLVQNKLQTSNLLSPKITFIRGNIEDDLANISLTQKQFDAAVAINVLQDVDAERALRNINSLLKSGGSLRATFISRETQDAFWADDLSHDPISGRSYTFSRLHQSINLPPLGVIDTGESEKPFYRIEQYFSRIDVENLLSRTGFEIESVNIILFPLEMVERRWSSSFHAVSLTQQQKNLLKIWDGFPDAFDVIAIKR